MRTLIAFVNPYLVAFAVFVAWLIGTSSKVYAGDCYQVEIDGTLTYLGSDPSNCAGYVLIAASEYPDITYWAELAQTFEPGTVAFNDAMSLITGALVLAWTIRLILRRIAPKM